MAIPLKSSLGPAATDAGSAALPQAAGEQPRELVKAGPRPWLESLGSVLGLRRHAPAAAGAADVPPTVPATLPAAVADPVITLDALYELALRLRQAWTAETSSEPGRWSRQDPAMGQGAATACVVQDLIGGTIVEAVAIVAGGERVSHFYNEVEGFPVDLTPGELPRGSEAPTRVERRDGFATMRDYLLSLPGTQARYELLRKRIGGVD
jgi:hypothetical protein